MTPRMLTAMECVALGTIAATLWLIVLAFMELLLATVISFWGS